MEKLSAESQEIGKALYEQEAAADAEGAAAGDTEGAVNEDPNVVDAEVVDEEDDKK